MILIRSYWVNTHIRPHTVRDVIPTLTESREIQIERPISRSDGQTVILKTSHLCQWLESVAAFFTTITAQSQTDSKGTYTHTHTHTYTHRLSMLFTFANFTNLFLLPKIKKRCVQHC